MAKLERNLTDSACREYRKVMQNFAASALMVWRVCVCLVLALCAMCVAAVADEVQPESFTNLFQLRRGAEQSPHVVHPFRIVAEVMDVDSARGVLALRDESGTQFIRVGLTNRDIEPGAIVCLEGSGCAVKLERFGLAIVPGMVVDNDGIHPMVMASGKVFLPAGRNPIKLEWFNWFGDSGLTLEFEGPNSPRGQIPAAMLSRAAVDRVTGRTNFLSGLDYRCWEGVWEALPDFRTLQPVKTGVATNFDMQLRSRTNTVGLQFEGAISIPETGLYTFHLRTDDGGRLFVGHPFVDVRVLGQQRPVAAGITPASLLETNHGSWVTLEGTVSAAGVWSPGGESRLRVENEDIRMEVFESGDFSARIPVRQRVRVFGFYENIFTHEGYPIPGRLLILNWKAVKPGGEPGATKVSPATYPAATNAVSVLATAAEIKGLTLDVAKQELPVLIRGVVTASISKYTGVVVQDPTGGVFVEFRDLILPQPLQRGDLCEIEGVTGPGGFAPVVVPRRIARLGHGQLPKPMLATRDQLLNGSLDTEYAEIDGAVTEVQNRRLTLITQGHQISVEFPDSRPEALRDLENALIRIRGCVFTDFDFGTRKFKPGSLTVRSATIDVLQLPPANFFDSPQKSIGQLLFYDPQAAPFRRLKVAGQVIHSRAGEFFLSDGTNGLLVTAQNQEPFAVGDLVEAVGFLALRHQGAELKDAVLRKIGWSPLPAATKLPSDQLFQGRHAGTLVQVDATLINHWREASELVIELQSGFLAFRARLREGQSAVYLPASGSRLSLTGVYAPHGTAAGDGTVSGFDLLLSAPSGIRVLTTPPWWTLKRVLVLAGVLAAILGAVLIWNKELHWKVEERGRQLETEISHRQRVEMQHAAEAERARIARDLHDELGTGLTAVSLLASAGLGQFQDGEKIRARFQSIAEKARALVSGLDVIVWAIDPRRNSLQSFADYVGRYAGELFAASTIDCRLRIRMESGALVLTEAARHNLFLAVKEALNNVIRHASATEVELQILQAGDRLEIVIADNGCGFDQNSAIKGGSGLTNFQDRLQALRGECHVESQPAKGTMVKFLVPLQRDAGELLPST